MKPFISYAQNLEDVMLGRALKDVQNGFYIDVGAWRPVDDSVTKAFYDMGWHGVNIEPVWDHYLALKKHRPHDVNLDLIVHSSTGTIEFSEVHNSGISTTDPALAEQYRQVHRMKSYPKACDTLANICAAHVKGEIHFLKVDVEGAEKDVLLGMDFTKYRPWIILLESVDPNGNPSFEWESILFQSGYEFVYFDGLNRFYVSREHSELKDHFQVPPNVFDQYVRHSETIRGIRWRMWRRVENFLFY